jgi:blue copper oxidase
MKSVFFLLSCLCSAFLSAQTYNPLWIPDTLSGSNITLTIKDTFAQLRATGNQTITGGINNSQFWGPTIFINKGDTVHMNVLNKLNDSTTIHWHGMHLPAVMDGGPHQVIPPGTLWQPYWKVTNNAATYWYHPHLHEMTLEHLSKGIGGFIIVNDQEESALALPRKYGIDDIPLMLTSRRYNTGNQFVVQNVAYGDYLLVNGTRDPEITLPKQIVRLRLLNAEVERAYNFGFSDNRKFYIIANDGGLLDKPVQVSKLLVAVGERYEILVDLSNDNVGSSINLMSYNANQPFGFPGGEPAAQGNFGSLLNNKDFNCLRINIGQSTNSPITSIPTSLISNQFINSAEATVNRSINVKGGVPGNPTPFNFNDKIFDINRIDNTVSLNAIEKWTITNSNVFGHTFHIHDVQFKLVSRNGNTNAVGLHEQGWKDVLYLPRNENATFIAKFDDYADPIHPFMYHCHFSNHEDDGMMGQFVVNNPSSIIENMPDESQYTLFPNPASDVIFIENTGIEIYYITIINSVGKSVMMLPQPEIHKGISIAHLPKGMYYMQIMDAATKTTITKQFSK